MTGYIPVNEACIKARISLYMLNKYINEGKVRVKDTTDMTQKNRTRVRYVSYQDILDVLNCLELSYVDIKLVKSLFGISPRVVRYQIKNHRLRWRRNGSSLQPCVVDLELYVSGSTPESAVSALTIPSQAPSEIRS